VLNLQRFANGALACHELGWRPAKARQGGAAERDILMAPNARGATADRTHRLYE
jgi:hypothetical protein